MEERPYAERVDGIIVTLPAKRISFYLEPTKDIFGRPTYDLKPLMLPETRTAEFLKSIAQTIEEAKEARKEEVIE